MAGEAAAALGATPAAHFAGGAEGGWVLLRGSGWCCPAPAAVAAVSASERWQFTAHVGGSR
jgi:hypothetical protein